MGTSYNVETASLQGRTITSNFFRKMETNIKEAADAATLFVRQKMQGEGIVRRIMEPVFLTEDQLDIDEGTDQPKKIVEKDQLATATFIPFYGTNEQQYFKGSKYAIYFGKTESDRYYKSKFELMTYRNDIRQLLSDSCVKALTDGEDGNWFNAWENIVAANPTEQSFARSGGLIAQNITWGIQKLLDQKIPIGKIIMHKSTFIEVLHLPQTIVGDTIASRHYDDGIGTEEKLWGIPCVTTIKDQFVPPNTIWFFGKYAPEENVNFLGNFFTIQDATLYLEQKADMINFYAYGAPGIGIGNTLAGIKVTI